MSKASARGGGDVGVIVFPIKRQLYLWYSCQSPIRYATFTIGVRPSLVSRVLPIPRIAAWALVLASSCMASEPDPVLPAPATEPVMASSVTASSDMEPARVAEVRLPRVPDLDCRETQMAGYRNGRKFTIRVVHVDGRPVEVETANAYWAMQQAAAADGIELGIYSGFRSHEDQRYFRRCFRTCSCNGCAPAAKPGHSKHQSGRAIDFGQWPGAIVWLRENGRRFRFFPTVKREPWHWEYKPRRSVKWPTACATP